MYRVSLTLIVIALLVGCTSSPQIVPTNTTEAQIIAEPTTLPQSPTAAPVPTTEAPITENTLSPEQYTIQEYPVPAGTHPHDVAPDPNSDIVWYTAQHIGALGVLDPATGETRHIPLGRGSSPHQGDFSPPIPSRTPNHSD